MPQFQRPQFAVAMRSMTVLLGLLAFVSNTRAADPLPRGLRAGAAISNITPEIGRPIVGGFVPAPSKHVHDELHARCLVLDDGKTRLAIVVCDLLGIHRSVSDEARRLILEDVGLSRENVMISATHTHSASSALGVGRYDIAQDLDDYQKFVARRIADGVRRAVNTLRPAELAFGTVDVPEHVFNRRWHMRPGTGRVSPFGTADVVTMNPPAGSPNLVEPAGPIDPQVSFFAVREPEGKPISVFATYSLHYVGGTGALDISSDYFGLFCEEIGRLWNADRQDPPFVGLLANGTSGDINNINFREPRGRKAPYEQMKYVAHDVAAKVHGALKTLKFENDVRLGARYREAEIGLRRPSEAQLEWARKTLEAPASEAKGADLPRIYAERVTRLAKVPDTARLPVQVFRIGAVSFGTMPCEVFCEIGLDYRRQSALQPAFMVSLNHGYFGYLPTPRQHEWGGYETWLGTNRVEKTASEKMLKSLLEMTQELAAEK